MTLAFAVALIVLIGFAYYLGQSRALKARDGRGARLHSLPSYYGMYAALWCAIPAAALLAVWSAFQGTIVEQMILADITEELSGLDQSRIGLVMNDIRNLATGGITSSDPSPAIQEAAARYSNLMVTAKAAMFVIALALGSGGLLLAFRRISPDLRARNRVERIIMTVLMLSSTIAILVTLGIVLSLVFEASRFFAQIPITEFLFGLQWSPQIAIRADQVGSSGAFGAIPVFAGTMLISFIAMCVAAPIGLFSAIYMAEYANRKVRGVLKPVLEILAGIPTVVYGFFAALTVAPTLRDLGDSIGLDVASESALAAGAVMGIMIIPFVSSLSDDVISAVPSAMREGSYGLGATKSETIRKVVLPAALPGIVGALLLAVSRAIGETMIVVMAAGLSANLTANPFEAVTTVTVQIVTLLTGDQEFDSPKTLAAFALGLLLFVVTLILNVIALRVVRKYREQYD
ncbi:MAG: phosphate ABC transporter permease subunit PstC [Marivibrio sp.]|uniref:phosphate ABC transporter permease subunit PstC n=1 Tax=Marivibrio sp. TaxID=2039719 RepID=UPI0032ED92CF